MSLVLKVLQAMRWPLLVLAWVLFLGSLLAPAFHGGTGWFAGLPFPVVLMLVLIFLAPQAFPLSLATACFAASPLFVWLWPRGIAGLFWRMLPLGLLGVWALPAWQGLAAAGAVNSLFTDGSRIAWGYYLWAASYSVALGATMIPPPPRPPRSRRPDPRRGFPVIIAGAEAPLSGVNAPVAGESAPEVARAGVVVTLLAGPCIVIVWAGNFVHALELPHWGPRPTFLCRLSGMAAAALLACLIYWQRKNPRLYSPWQNAAIAADVLFIGASIFWLWASGQLLRF